MIMFFILNRKKSQIKIAKIANKTINHRVHDFLFAIKSHNKSENAILSQKQDMPIYVLFQFRKIITKP